MAADYSSRPPARLGRWDVGSADPEDRVGLVGHAHQMSLAVDGDLKLRIVPVTLVVAARDGVGDGVLVDGGVEIFRFSERIETVVRVLDLVAIGDEHLSARP